MYPSILNTFPRPSTTSRLDNPSHSALHNTVSSIVGQIEAVIGVEGASSVVGTLQYFIKSPDSDGGGHIQTAKRGGTGQTTFTKGDLLVATSSSVLAKLAVSSVANEVLLADPAQSAGMKWGAVPLSANVQTFTSSGTWTKPTETPKRVLIQVWGGGGSGAKSNGCGGGGGAYNERWIAPASLGATETVTIGAGGLGRTTNVAGEVGGDTTFGSFLTGFGGGAGHSSFGGGGGGRLGVGQTNPGLGGSPLINLSAGIGFSLSTGAGNGNTDGGGGGGGFNAGSGVSVGGSGTNGGGGGGGRADGAGGNSFNGGGGGGSSNVGAGGTSVNGGNGGAGVAAGAGGVAGSAPSGGGGGTDTGTTSGAGGAGQCIVTTWF